MIKKIQVAIEVLQVGKRLSNPIPWKNVQAFTSLLLAIIPVGILAVNTFTEMQINLTNEEIGELATTGAGFLVSGYGLYNWFTTVATTNKIGGLPGGSESDS